MFSILQKSLSVLAIFLITPLAIIIINWHWQPEALNHFSKYLYWVTETAGSPYSIISCGIFSIVFALCLKIHSKSLFLKLIVLLAIAIISGQLIKTVIKNCTTETRPFVSWMESEYQISDQYFYSLPRPERQGLIEDYAQQSSQIPNWLYHHWGKETGYSFPSGHTLFAVTWAFMALFLFNFKRHYLTVSVIIIWALTVLISRLMLGMHHPIDVICSTIIAWIIALCVYQVAVKWRFIER